MLIALLFASAEELVAQKKRDCPEGSYNIPNTCECAPITPGPQLPDFPGPSGPTKKKPTGKEDDNVPITGGQGRGADDDGTIERGAGDAATSTVPVTGLPNPQSGSEPAMPAYATYWPDDHVATEPKVERGGAGRDDDEEFPMTLYPGWPFRPACSNICLTCGFDHSCAFSPRPASDIGTAAPAMVYHGSSANSNGTHAAFYTEPGNGLFYHQFHDASGALLDHMEVHSLSGSVARYEVVYSQYFAPYALIKSVTDAYDNVTLYEYDGADRLTTIKYPTGIHEQWDYSPSWIGTGGWNASNYSGVEVQFVDTNNGNALLSRRAYLFHRLRDPQGNLVPGARPFAGDLLFRTYQAQLFVVDPAPSGQLATLPPGLSQSAEKYAVTELTYHAGTRRVHEFRSLTAPSILQGGESNQQALVAYTYVELPANSGFYRAATEAFPQEQRQISYSYVLGDTASPNRVTQFTWTEQDISDPNNPEDLIRHVETLDGYGRPTKIVTTPLSTNGLPRTADADNGGWAEPTSRTLDMLYGACTSCSAKPTSISDPATGRTYEFDYDPLTGLLVEERFPSPSGSGTGSREYKYQPRTPGKLYSGYDIAWLEDEFDHRTNYTYTQVPRVNLEHGLKNKKVTRTSPTVTLADGSTGPAVTETFSYDVSAPVSLPSPPGGQSAYVGYLEGYTDGDGVETKFYPDQDGRRWRTVVNPGGGNDEIETREVRDALGRVTQLVTNHGSAVEQATNFEYNSADMVTRVWRTIGAQTQDERFFYDSLGHLTVHLERNVTSTDGAPVDFGNPGRTETAREWLRTEWQYESSRLARTFEDRRPLDRDESGSLVGALGARFLRTEYSYDARGRIIGVVHPSGATQTLTYDDYGTLYKSSLETPGATPVVERWFVNAALDVMRHIRGDGGVELVTDIERNGAGVIEKVTEPSVDRPDLSAPTPWYPITGQKLPFAIHEFDTDGRGDLVEARTYDGTAQTPTLLARSVTTFDELGRPYRVDRFDPPGSSVPARSTSAQWQGATQVVEATRDFDPANPGTQTRSVTSLFDGVGRLAERTDSLGPNPNKVITIFEPNASFSRVVIRRLWDGHPSAGAYVDRETEYVRDGLGRVTQILQEPGQATPLTHSFAYYSTGATESYTDPAGKLYQYLADGQGRLVEHYLPAGANSIWNGTDFRDWTGVDSRREVERLDGRLRQTTTIIDFAGRVQAVMNPGAGAEPTAADPHKPFAKYFAYNEASQLIGVYQGDAIVTTHYRDGRGRLVVRSTPSAGINQYVSWFHGRDIILRNPLGQVIQVDNHPGPDGAIFRYQREVFAPDALGRNHRESFTFTQGANTVDIESGYLNGDPVRRSLTYDNNAGGDSLWLTHTPDAIGRLSAVGWRTTLQGQNVALADYWHEGVRIRRRATHWTSGSSFDTDYTYDDFGRMDRITQSFDPNAEVEFFYDAASNLVKEEYQKQGANQEGDRFTYDEHHRLEKAWLGSNQAHLNASDPDAPVGAFVKKLTYGLDSANNRSSVTTQAGQGGSITTEPYLTQDFAPLGPSNRYEEAGTSTPLYDERGNTIFDGNFFYVYDDLNRLTEIYILTGDSAAATTSQTSGPASMSAGQICACREAELARGQFEVSGKVALAEARSAILQRVPNHPGEILGRHRTPRFLSGLRQPMPAADASRQVAGASGPSSTSSSSSTESATMSLYALYQYDAMNRRVNRTIIGGQTWFYAWDGWQEAEELVFDGSFVVPVRQFAWGEQLDELVAYRYRQTMLGSFADFFIAEGGAHCPSRVLNDQGQVVEVQEYDPYGKASVYDGSGASGGSQTQLAVGNVFQWKGHRVDPETGLAYARNRYYAMAWGRFLSLDPAGTWSDRATKGNGYSYGSNSPLVEVDPYGLQVMGRGRYRLHFNPETGSYGTGNPRGRTEVEAWRDVWVGDRPDDFGDLAFRDLDNLEIKVDGEWRRLSEQEKQLLEDVRSDLQDAVQLHNLNIGYAFGMAAAAAGAFGNANLPTVRAPRAASRVGAPGSKSGSSQYTWPPNNGFAGKTKDVELCPGTRVDRYGGPRDAKFVSPAGTPYGARSLKPGSRGRPLMEYEVIKPIPAKSGQTAPWFGQRGGGTQYQLSSTVEDLVTGGYLREVK